MDKQKLATASTDINVPVSVFKRDLSPYEVIVKYLHENKGLKYSEIGRLTGRDQRAVRVTYVRAAKKQPKRIRARGRGDRSFPLSRLKDSGLSPAEAIASFLKEQGLRYCEIGDVLGRDDRTVWMLCHRAEQKMAS